MKKILLLIPILMFATFGCKENADAVSTSQVDIAQFEEYIKKIEDKGASVKVEKLSDIKEMPGFAFVKITSDNNGNVKETKVITNGRLLIDSQVIDLKEEISLTSLLNFQYAEPKNIDVSSLTLAGGKKDSKNIIVEITDFQCPYCKEANKLFKQKLKDKSDYALYIMHMPLDMHPNALAMAHIFEAGMSMGYNFKNDLFEFNAEDLIQKTAEEYKTANNIAQFSQEDVTKIFKEVDNKIIDIFAGKTSDANKFKTLVSSPEIIEKVENAKKQAETLSEGSTPVFYFNGKIIQGFDAPLLNKVLNDIK